MVLCLSATTVKKTTGAEPAVRLMALSTHTLCSGSVPGESPHAALHQHDLVELSWVKDSETQTGRTGF